MKILALLFLIMVNINTTFAMEEFVTIPGSRAMGMAGNFLAQADDSSAIWYNPAALVHYDFIKKDFTVEFGERLIAGKTNFFTDSTTGKSLSTESTLKYVAAYSRTSKKINKTKPIGIGFSYFSPYKIRILIDAPQSLVTDKVFGEIDATYHQFSSMVSSAISSDFFGDSVT